MSIIKEKKKCSIEGCNEIVYAKELCKKHYNILYQRERRNKKKYCQECGDELIIGGNCKHRYIYCNKCGKEMRLKRSRDYYNYYKGELTPIRRERTAWIRNLNPNKLLELVGYKKRRKNER